MIVYEFHYAPAASSHVDLAEFYHFLPKRDLLLAFPEICSEIRPVYGVAVERFWKQLRFTLDLEPFGISPQHIITLIGNVDVQDMDAIRELTV